MPVPATPPLPPFTIKAACEHLHVSRQTINNLIAAGQLRRYKIGASVRIPAADVFGLVGGGTDENA